MPSSRACGPGWISRRSNCRWKMSRVRRSPSGFAAITRTCRPFTSRRLARRNARACWCGRSRETTCSPSSRWQGADQLLRELEQRIVQRDVEFNPFQPDLRHLNPVEGLGHPERDGSSVDVAKIAEPDLQLALRVRIVDLDDGLYFESIRRIDVVLDGRPVLRREDDMEKFLPLVRDLSL